VAQAPVRRFREEIPGVGQGREQRFAGGRVGDREPTGAPGGPQVGDDDPIFDRQADRLDHDASGCSAHDAADETQFTFRTGENGSQGVEASGGGGGVGGGDGDGVARPIGDHGVETLVTGRGQHPFHGDTSQGFTHYALKWQGTK